MNKNQKMLFQDHNILPKKQKKKVQSYTLEESSIELLNNVSKLGYKKSSLLDKIIQISLQDVEEEKDLVDVLTLIQSFKNQRKTPDLG